MGFPKTHIKPATKKEVGLLSLFLKVGFVEKYGLSLQFFWIILSIFCEISEIHVPRIEYFPEIYLHY